MTFGPCPHLLLAAMMIGAAIRDLPAQVPHLVHYQGRIAVDGTNFSGSGQFKFALVDGSGSATYWSHDGTSVGGSPPATHVPLTVTSGLYSLVLGDPAVLDSAGNPMRALAPSDLDHPEVRLRVWFNDGTNGFQRLAPDRRLAAVGYALLAESVPDGSITSAKLAPGSVTADKLAPSVGGGNLQASLSASDASLLGLGYIKVQSIPAPLWNSPPSSSVPSPRSHHSAIWTGSDMIIWGGKVGTSLSNQGGIYDPALNQWATLPTSTASPARSHHTAVWTGERMIVWGGFTGGGESQSGAMYAPVVADSDPPIGGWLATSLTSAPEARSAHTAVWNGSEMLVWGGKNSGGVLASGAAYTPPTGPLVPGTEGSWSAIPSANAPAARHGHSAVWTGTKMLIWGGLDSAFQPLATGGIYDPGTGTWTALPSGGAPSPRTGHTAVWTGSEMVIFGGTNSEVVGSTANLLNDGAVYDPVAGTWTSLPSLEAPSARHRHGAVWTGSEMLIFGGETLAGQIASSAGAYNAVERTWRALPSTTTGRAGQSGVWSGSVLLVFGANGLQTLDPAPAVYFYGRF